MLLVIPSPKFVVLGAVWFKKSDGSNMKSVVRDIWMRSISTLECNIERIKYLEKGILLFMMC